MISACQRTDEEALVRAHACFSVSLLSLQAYSFTYACFASENQTC